MKLWLALGVTLTCAAARAENRPVYVDWSGVSDRAIETCKLRGLETLMVQSLIEEHFAVVGGAAPDAITIAITTGPRSFELRGSAGGESRSDWVDIPQPCDSSIALTLTQHVVAMAHTLDVKTKAEPNGAASTGRAGTSSAAADGEATNAPRFTWSGRRRPFEIAAVGVLPGAADTPAGVGIRYNEPAGPLQLNFGADFVFWRGHDLTILEPDLTAGVSYGSSIGSAAWSVGVEAAAIVHVFTAASDSGGKFDGRLGLPLTLGVAHNRVILTVMPYSRLDRLEHFVRGARIYTSEHWGILARLGVGFGAP